MILGATGRVSLTALMFQACHKKEKIGSDSPSFKTTTNLAILRLADYRTALSSGQRNERLGYVHHNYRAKLLVKLWPTSSLLESHLLCGNKIK